MPGKVGLNALGRLGWGVGSIKSGKPGVGPPPPIEQAIILEDETGFVLLEDGSTVVTES